MARLAIVDVAHGHQPMANDDESIVIVYNGEVYNAPALRQELEQSRRSLPHAQRHRGHPPPLRERPRARGRASRRDVGIRHPRSAAAARGPEPRSVRDQAAVRRRHGDGARLRVRAALLRSQPRAVRRFFSIDHDAAHAMLSWSYVPENSTIYEGVQPPRAGDPPDDRPRHRQRGDADLLDARAVTRRRAGPLARRGVRATSTSCCGAPSRSTSRVTCPSRRSSRAASTRRSSLPTRTRSPRRRSRRTRSAFASVRSTSRRSPGRRRQRIGVPIRVEMFDEEKARGRLPDALLAYDEPFGDSSSLPTYLLSHHVARDYKVALGGDGGDEVFAGYKKYLIVQLRRPVRGERRGFATRSARALGPFARMRDPDEWSPGPSCVRRTFASSRAASTGDRACLRAAHAVRAAGAYRGAHAPAGLGARGFEEAARARFDRARRNGAAEIARHRSRQHVLQRHAREGRPREHGVQPRSARAVPRSSRCRVRRRLCRSVLHVGPLAQPFIGKRVLRALHERRFGRRSRAGRSKASAFPSAVAARTVRERLRAPVRQAPARSFRHPVERRAVRRALPSMVSMRPV